MWKPTAYDFFERQRSELVNGDLIDKAGRKPPDSRLHAAIGPQFFRGSKFL
jgi:hypothetical protein